MPFCAKAVRVCAFVWTALLATSAANARYDSPYPAHMHGHSAAAHLNTLYLEVFINGFPANLIAEFHATPAGYAATPAELRDIGLDLDDAQGDENGLVPLDSIHGLTYAYDPQTQTIRFDLPPDLLMPQILDASKRRQATPGEAHTGSGAVLNYSLFASLHGGAILTFPEYTGLAGTFDARFFSSYGELRSGLIAKSAPGLDEPVLIRLDSAWSFEDSQDLMSYRAGDLISGGLAWTRPVRLAGVQASRNFSLRHDLITSPASVIAGTAAVPSTVDVFVNSARAYSGQVDSGPFQIVNLPAASGPGNVQVVIRDTLGRETVTSASYYVSPMLLAPGLLDFSVEAGYPRRSYGLVSDDYSGDPFLSGSARYGVSDRVTVEGHSEIGPSLLNAGAGLVFGLGPIGLASMSLAGSRFLPGDCLEAANDCGAMHGLKFGLSVEASIADWRIYARTLRTLGDYADIASVTASNTYDDEGYYPYLYAPAVTLDQLSISAPLPWDRTHVNLNLTHTLDIANDRKLILGLSHSRPAFQNGTFSVSAYHDIENPDNTGIFAGLYFTLGSNISASAGFAGSHDGYGISSSLAKPETAENGSYGWRLRSQEGASSYRSAYASYRAEAVRVEAGAAERSGRTEFHAQAEGAVAVLGGDVFLANRIDDSFAVVDATAPNVKVLHENRVIGVTGADGKVLVPSLRSWQPNVISIDPVDLPLNAGIAETGQTVTPAGRGGVVVRFDIEAEDNAALVSFLGAGGVAVPIGSAGVLNAGEDRFLIGYDGQAYISSLRRNNTAVVTQPDGESCIAEFSFAPQPEKQVFIEDVPCL